MTQLKSSYSQENYQHIVSEYHQKIHQTMVEIKKAILVLEQPEENLSQKVSLVQAIITKTVDNLQDLESKNEQVLPEVTYEKKQAA